MQHLRLKRALCIVDIETTGLDPAADRIVEVAVLRLDPHRDPVLFVRRCNPGVPIPPQATTVHHISDEDVVDCPQFCAIAREFLRVLAYADLGGFGIRHFDLPFLACELQRAGHPLCLRGRAVIDAQTIFFQREPRDLAAAVRRYCRREHEQAHQAEYDARAALDVLDAMLGRHPDLPRVPAELHRRLIDVDIAGWFRRDGDSVIFARGKHRGRSLADVARCEPGYLNWLLSQPVLPDVQHLVGRALEQDCE
jgi:DNA polymerase-3 subunit epsilon